MNNNAMDPLKQLHGYEEWRGRNSLEENLLVWGFSFSGDEFPGWQLTRSQEILSPGWPPAVQTRWQATEEERNALMLLTLYQAAGRTEAHEALVQLLGEFQSPDIARLEQGQPGDVAFAPPEDSAILFARANLAVLMQNGGAKIVPMTPLALRLDETLSRPPEAEEGQVVPQVRRFSAPEKGLKAGVGLPLEVEAAEPLERPLWYMLFSATGELQLVEGRPEYVPARAGAQQVRLYAINPNRGAAQEQLTFTVE